MRIATGRALAALCAGACLLTAAPLSYRISARLDDSTATISAHQRTVVRNPTSAPLSQIRLWLHANAFRSRETEFARTLRRMEQYDLDWLARKRLGGTRITDVRLDGRPVRPDGEGEDPVRLLVMLPAALAPGESAALELDFTLTLPGFFTSWLGHEDPLYVLANWYPRVLPGDSGAAPWLADFDVELTLPGDLVVGATGRLLDGADETGWMQLPVESREPRPATKTLRFRADDVAGFAWVAGPDFVLLRDSIDGVNVNILTRSRNRASWLAVPKQAREIVTTYLGWYGPPPEPIVTVVDATGIVGSSWTGSGIAVLPQSRVPFTRLRERALARGLAQHWFPLPSDPFRPAFSWLTEGPAVYSEIRYLQHRYGDGNLLDLGFQPGLLARLTDSYYHQILYYIAASNRILPPLAAPALSERFTAADAQPSHAGKFFEMLSRQLGPAALDSAIRSYLSPRQALGPDPDAFIAACCQAAGRDVSWLFDRWLAATGGCDYSVRSVRRDKEDIVVGLERLGDIAMPVDVELALADGRRLRRTWDLPARSGVVQFLGPGRVKKVTLDPDERLLETDRWNNHWPRRVELHPIFALPSFDAYQVFVGPGAWYDDYSGVRLAAWAQGRQFMDLGPLHGRHTWSVTETYSLRRREWTTAGWYSTPVTYLSDRLRLTGFGNHTANVLTTGEILFVAGLGPVWRHSGASLKFGYFYQALRDLKDRDTLAWEKAAQGELVVKLLQNWRRSRFIGDRRVDLGWGSTPLGATYDYLRFSAEENHVLRFDKTRGVRLRAFAGAVLGRVIRQNRYFLSGGITANDKEPVVWAYEGAASGQEHWHFEEGPNVRGYAGDYLSGQWAWGLNFELIPLPYLRAFFDIGSVAERSSDPELWRPRMDAGLRLKLGPLYADFPLWRWQVGGKSELHPYWMIGLNLSGVTDF